MSDETWSKRPMIEINDEVLESALQSASVERGQSLFVVRPSPRSLRSYASYETAMAAAVTKADELGDVIVETYQYQGGGCWLFIRSITVIVKRRSRWDT